MELTNEWRDDVIGLDPSDQRLSVTVVVTERLPDDDHLSDTLSTFRSWGWTIAVVETPAAASSIESSAAGSDVVLFYGIDGNRRLRSRLHRRKPVVGVVVPRGRFAVLRLLAEAGWRRSTTVLVVRRDSESTVLRTVSRAALVRVGTAPGGVSAEDLAAVLLRARVWWQQP